MRDEVSHVWPKYIQAVFTMNVCAPVLSATHPSSGITGTVQLMILAAASARVEIIARAIPPIILVLLYWYWPRRLVRRADLLNLSIGPLFYNPGPLKPITTVNCTRCRDRSLRFTSVPVIGRCEGTGILCDVCMYTMISCEATNLWIIHRVSLTTW